MTIAEIKDQLPITAVLAHYGLEPTTTGSLACPFHVDEKASMKIYPETNTAYCFAGGCDVESVDVIDFILHMEKCDKRTAILKAKEMIGQPVTKPVASNVAPPTEPLDVKAIYAASLKTMQTHTTAQAYCLDRGLKWWDFLGVGYKSRKTPDKWGRGCILLPLKDRENNTVSLYGRAIKGSGHYYTADRRGLYPYYPDPVTRTLVLTESILDAASIRREDLGLDCYAILALYGTNGLTAEHRTVITELKDLREIILTLDGDEAGRKATTALATQLHELRPGLKITTVNLPDGEDVNSITAGMTDLVAEFGGLLDARIVIAPPVPAMAPATAPAPTLNTANPHNLIYRSGLASYEIKGGVRYAAKDLDCLKITVVIINSEGRKSRQKVDLYEDKQITRAAGAVADRLGLRADLIELDLDRLTDRLETYRDGLRQENDRAETKRVTVAGPNRERCLTFLKAPSLLDNINEQIERAGIVGEEHNRLLLFVVASSYGMPQTLHALIQGASGSGKTRLLGTVAELIPVEEVERYTRVTEGSFYNGGEYDFVNKLLCFEDLDGLKEEALFAVRELQSNGIIRGATSVKNELGNVEKANRTVRGPIASLSCTTKADVYEDNISRCFVVAVDESREQSLRIIEYQNKWSAGKVDRGEEKQVRNFLQNCLRLLEPLEVVNPYAERIRLPEEAHKIRRLNELYQCFVRQVTLLNQYQRERDARGRLVTAPEDLRVACEVLFESIVLKVDELDGSLRQFFERVKNYVRTKGENYAFDRFELRRATGVSKTQQHRHVSKLVELEYLRQEGFANRGYRYKIAHWDDQDALRSRIKMELTSQIESLND